MNEHYLFSAPGRTEIGGNHTDHQHGCVLAAAVNLKITADVALNGSHLIRVFSKGYQPIEVNITELAAKQSEQSTSTALVRGIAAAFAQRGCILKGFDAVTESSVLKGSGLSSSAAFEVLIGTIINTLLFGGRLNAVEIARIGQYAENVYFGKPCGLMDQTASSVGGFVFIDFKNPEKPQVKKLDFDFSAAGHSLCIIDSGADHADLTHEYAAITDELSGACRVFGKKHLRDVDEAEFYDRINEVRRAVGDRAALRAIHVFEDNKRVIEQVKSLESGDFAEFLRLVRRSGLSSWHYLQNVVPTGSTKQQQTAVALALCERLLGDRGAFRIHGGGFAGTVQAFVPNDILDGFKAEIERVLGESSCHILSISSDGGICHGVLE